MLRIPRTKQRAKYEHLNYMGTYACVVLYLQYADRTWPILILGIVMFIPGAYHVRIAYYAWHGYTGYSFQDIPEFEQLLRYIYLACPQFTACLHSVVNCVRCALAIVHLFQLLMIDSLVVHFIRLLICDMNDVS